MLIGLATFGQIAHRILALNDQQWQTAPDPEHTTAAELAEATA
jgi:hypothetical protein